MLNQQLLQSLKQQSLQMFCISFAVAFSGAFKKKLTLTHRDSFVGKLEGSTNSTD